MAKPNNARLVGAFVLGALFRRNLVRYPERIFLLAVLLAAVAGAGSTAAQVAALNRTLDRLAADIAKSVKSTRFDRTASGS